MKKFKPPREFIEVKEDPNRKGVAIEDEDELEKLYKPSGPDGRGWGEFRQYTEEELRALEEEKNRKAQEDEHMEKLYNELQERKEKILIDEDERVSIGI